MCLPISLENIRKPEDFYVLGDIERHQKQLPKCSVKKLLLQISQDSQENTSARVSFLITLQASVCLRPSTLLKKRLWQRCFPVNFVKFKNTCFYRKLSVAVSEKPVIWNGLVAKKAARKFSYLKNNNPYCIPHKTKF